MPKGPVKVYEAVYTITFTRDLMALDGAKAMQKANSLIEILTPMSLLEKVVGPSFEARVRVARRILDGDRSQAYERALDRAHAQDVSGAQHSLRDRDWR